MDDQDVGLGPTRHVGGHRSEQAAGDGAEADVADHQKVGLDLLGQVDQGVDRSADDGLLLDVLGSCGVGTVPGFTQDRVDGALPAIL